MLHLLYILAFTIIAFLAVSNLIRSLITVSMSSQGSYSSRNSARNRRSAYNSRRGQPLHPELVDEEGQPISEPLLVMRSVSVEDARQQLDALYNASPNPPQSNDSEED
ncbi:MAG: DUF2973 domain-containing protein [Microcystaceae cyanobacterium]